MEDIIRTADGLQKLCQHQHWRFAIIGGVALQHWGRPRLTRDVDLCLLTGFEDASPFIEILLDKYLPRIDDAEEFAQHHRVLLLKTPEGIGIDIALGGIPFEERVVSRALHRLSICLTSA